MSSMKFKYLLKFGSSTDFWNLSRRNVGNLYIGSNVQQRAQLGENYLENTKVVAINGSKSIDLVSKILKDEGANLLQFDYHNNHVKEIQKAVRNADILLDGVQKGGEIEEAAASNPNLIVAQCDCEDPFSAMSAVARIAMALAEREKTSRGQRLIATDSLDYWRILNRSSRSTKF